MGASTRQKTARHFHFDALVAKSNIVSLAVVDLDDSNMVDPALLADARRVYQTLLDAPIGTKIPTTIKEITVSLDSPISHVSREIGEPPLVGRLRHHDPHRSYILHCQDTPIMCAVVIPTPAKLSDADRANALALHGLSQMCGIELDVPALTQEEFLGGFDLFDAPLVLCTYTPLLQSIWPDPADASLACSILGGWQRGLATWMIRDLIR